MTPEQGSELGRVDCILVDIDALGKLQLYAAKISSFHILPLDVTKAQVEAGAVRAIVRPGDLTELLYQFGWTKADVVVGADLFPTLGNEGNDTYGSLGDDD